MIEEVAARIRALARRTARLLQEVLQIDDLALDTRTHRATFNGATLTAELIDCETGVRELAEMLEGILAEAGDLIETRSPELAAAARAALRHYADETPRQAE